MPWKGEKNPYKIWLSEIILQQTRVDQGLSYYEKFSKTFPDVFALAKAEEKTVFKLWEGLGYYNRCRNLLATAKFIANEKHGKFPDQFDEIIKLKGVGIYTASAISSFAYGLPHAVVDGNVYRVLSRIFGIYVAIDSLNGKKQFAKLAQQLLDKNNSAAFNQAMMDFGATVCKPVPLCGQCIFRKHCNAFLNSSQQDLPVKKKKLQQKKRWFNYFLFKYKGYIAIQQRVSKDIWRELYEFPSIETSETSSGKVVRLAESEGLLKKKSYKIITTSPIFRQQLSHQLIMGKFFTISINSKPSASNGWTWVKESGLNEFAFPGIINQYLQKSGNDLVNSA